MKTSCLSVTGRLSALSLALLLFSPACSSIQRSPVPGVKNAIDVLQKDEAAATQLGPVPVADVIRAAKYEMGIAFRKLDDMKKFDPDNEALKGLTPQVGSGVFRGATQLVQTDGGNVSAVIPIHSYAGSTLAPSLGTGGQAASNQDVSIAFSFDPGTALTKPLERVETGGYVATSLISVFEQIGTIPKSEDGDDFGPDFTTREVRTNVSFSVQRTNEAGIGFVLVPPANDLTSVASVPALGVSRRDVATYTLNLNIPMITPNPASSKRVYEGIWNEDGELYLVERPFEAKDHDAAKRKLAAGATRTEPAVEEDAVDVAPRRRAIPRANPAKVFTEEPEYSF